ncbi:hypothetical protein DBR42_02805 [Pelomonas sp. HMWF004]|nr:hypothetical protein DBR42_02805 [Pelomonas sp. HMWF004]
MPPERSPEALLQLLHELDTHRPVALTRLAKRLDERVSVLLRALAPLGDAAVGGVAGPGWVTLHCDEAGRWTAQLTEAGRAQAGGAGGPG